MEPGDCDFACILQVWINYSALSAIGTWLYFEGLEQLFDLVSGVVVFLLFACVLMVWRNYSTLSVVSRD